MTIASLPFRTTLFPSVGFRDADSSVTVKFLLSSIARLSTRLIFRQRRLPSVEPLEKVKFVILALKSSPAIADSTVDSVR